MMYDFLNYRVGSYMTPNPKTVSRETTLRELKTLFDTHDFNSFPVVDGNRLVGLVTKLDFLKAFTFSTSQIVPHYDDLMDRTVASVMTTAVVHAETEAPLTRALQLMVEMRARSFPVLDSGGNLRGVIAREDIMRALGDATKVE